MKKAKNIANSRNNKIIKIVIISTILAVMVIGLTFARYIAEQESNKKLVEAENFYFTSNYLTEESDRIYTISNYSAGTEIEIEIYNYEDELRHTAADIVYEISSEELTAENIIKEEFVGTDLKVSKVKVKLNNENFVNGKATFILSAKSSLPFEKNIAATFNVYQEALAEDAYMEVVDSKNSYVVTATVITEGKEGEIIVTHPSTLVPDTGDERITEKGETYFKFIADKNSNYEFILFKENLDDIYAISSTNKFEIYAEVIGTERLPMDSLIGLGDSNSIRTDTSWGSYEKNDSEMIEYVTDENGNVGYVSKDNSSVSKLIPSDQPVNNYYSINVTIRGNWADNPAGFNQWGGTICAMSPAIDQYINWMAVTDNYLKIYSYDRMSYTTPQYTLVDITEYDNKYLNIMITAEKGQETKVYLNGELASTFESGNIPYQSNPELSIGDLRGERGLHFKGTIYNFALYNKVLSEDEVKAVWNYYNNQMNIQ